VSKVGNYTVSHLAMARAGKGDRLSVDDFAETGRLRNLVCWRTRMASRRGSTRVARRPDWRRRYWDRGSSIVLFRRLSDGGQRAVIGRRPEAV